MVSNNKSDKLHKVAQLELYRNSLKHEFLVVSRFLQFGCYQYLTFECFFKVAYRVQIWKKKTFCQNSDKFVYSFIKNNIMFMYMLCIYKKSNIILSLSKIDTLNFTMYILTILTCPLKIYVTGLHNLISMIIFFIIKVFLQFFFSFLRRPLHEARYEN